MIQELEAAILAKDTSQIVQILSTASEADRKAAQRPLKVFWLALGIDDYVVRHNHVDLKVDDIDVRKKRAQYKLTPMDKRSRTYDYDLSYIAWLAWFGLADHEHCLVYACVPDFEAESAQIMADRRPDWLEQWATEIVKPEGPSMGGRISSSYWVLLYHHGLAKQLDPSFLRLGWPDRGLPYAFEKQPEATKKVLRELPAVIEHLYGVPEDAGARTIPKTWEPLLSWIREEGLLDRKRFTEASLNALTGQLNQSERNSCIVFAKSAIGKPNAQSRKVSVAFESQWIALLSDAQAAIAGFALDQLVQVEKAGKLNSTEVVLELPHVFNHKPKGHARKAVAMLGRLAQNAELRDDAVRGLSFALSHPAKEVQEDAITQLALYLESADVDALESIRLHTETIAPTLRSRLETLLPGSTEPELPERETPVHGNANVYAARVDLIDQQTAELFRIPEALAAFDSGLLAEPGNWRMNQIRVLDHYEEIPPIETVEELVQVTSAAIETCECPDTLDRVIGAITRLYQQRPQHFDSLTKSLRSRACQEIMHRPMRGIVGGFFSEPVARCIGGWLRETKFFEDDLKPSRFPAGEFLWKVAERLVSKTAYPLLSTPTHRGGWIDPRVWVDRLRHIEQSEVEVLEQDLAISLLRLAPDRRGEAWQKVANDDGFLSSRMRSLVRVAIEPVEDNDHFQLDSQWPAQIWITAIRARDPWIDLSNYLPEEEVSQIPVEVWRLPDVIRPANFQWRALPQSTGRRPLPLVDSEPVLPEDRDPLEQEVEQMKEAFNGKPLNPESMLAILAIGKAEKKLSDGLGFLTAKLNFARFSYAAPFVYPYQATLWPMKLDWYWSAASICFSRRIESGASVEERYAQFLLPLLEPDRNMTPMAARALWIATASKDGNAKAMAMDVWIELTSSDRCETDVLVAAWNDVFSGGWMKLSRVAEVFAEVASASPLSAWIVAKLLEAFLRLQDTLPRDAAKLLEVLDECHQRLGLTVAESFREVLSQIKSGKAKQFAKSLMQREDHLTSERSEALELALQSRLSRAERNANQPAEALGIEN